MHLVWIAGGAVAVYPTPHFQFAPQLQLELVDWSLPVNPNGMSAAGLEPPPFPLYAVVFKEGENLGGVPYSPFAYQQLQVDAATSVPHALSHAAAAALPGLWYCMHLPNTLSELADVSAKSLKLSQLLHLEHHILLIPIEFFDHEHCAGFIAGREPILVACADDIAVEAGQRAEALGFVLPPVRYSQMPNRGLARHWRQIHQHFVPSVEYLGREPKLTHRLDTASTDLPRRWLARQMNWDATEAPIETLEDRDNLVARTFHEHAVLAAIARLAREGTEYQDAERKLPQVIREEHVRNRVPVALALPGVAPAYARIAYDSALRARPQLLSPLESEHTWSPTMHRRSDPFIERAAIEFVTTHHAIARGGVGFVLPAVPPEAFTVLAELERHFAGTQSGATVRRLLDRLDESAKPLWSDTLMRIIERASQLTVFTNFPIGLLRMPGDTAPLSARLPIAYRPLIPLLRTIQTELNPAIAVELDRDIRVLVAECIPAHDPVGQLSRRGWRVARGHVHEDASGITMDIVETLNLDALRSRFIWRVRYSGVCDDACGAAGAGRVVGVVRARGAVEADPAAGWWPAAVRGS